MRTSIGSDCNPGPQNSKHMTISSALKVLKQSEVDVLSEYPFGHLTCQNYLDGLRHDHAHISPDATAGSVE